MQWRCRLTPTILDCRDGQKPSSTARSGLVVSITLLWMAPARRARNRAGAVKRNAIAAPAAAAVARHIVEKCVDVGWVLRYSLSDQNSSLTAMRYVRGRRASNCNHRRKPAMTSPDWWRDGWPADLVLNPTGVRERPADVAARTQ